MSSEKCDKGTDCKTCGAAQKCSDEEKEAHERARLKATMDLIKYKFMVLSGKGGVGKSSVAVNLAVALAQEGFKVGLLDADIHGPNIPTMMGVAEERIESRPEGFLPITTESGVKVISVAFILRHKDDAIIWRGPLKHTLLKRFLGEVAWGALDYLVIDLPPGTGDEALSTAHLINGVDGAIIVTTPQDVALLDARKSITFLRQIKIPLIGVVENMSGFTCPHCNKEIDIFKVGGGEKAAHEMGVSFLGRIPLDPKMVICSDSGVPVVAQHPDSQAGEAFHRIVKAWRALLNFGSEPSSAPQCKLSGST